MKTIICILGLTAMALAGDKDERQELDNIFKQSNNKFTAQMFHEVEKENQGESIIMSAFSVLSPLAQLGLACVGQSHDEILSAISMPNDNVTKTVFTNMNKELLNIKGVTLSTATRIYITPDATLNQNFAAISRDVFKSDVKNVDFNKNETVNEINDWVENKTNHKIKNLLSESSVGPMTRAILVNAVYFKGTWKYQFKKELTAMKDFHVSNNKTVKVDTMAISDGFLYGESAELDAKLLQLPYEGEESHFLIVLPNQVNGIDQLKEKLRDPSLLDKAVAEMQSYTVDVTLPKFKIETETNLKKVLQNMNITKLFRPMEANLTNLIENEVDLYISDASQKAFIEVNEEGAEAAAANAMLISKTGFMPDFVMIAVDHPFYYQIAFRDLILYNGFFSQ